MAVKQQMAQGRSVMSHCVIEGEQCSACCKVLTIADNKSLRDWMSYIRWYGSVYPDDFKGEEVYHLLRKINKRKAKKLNKTLVDNIKNSQSYFTCVNYTGSGCSDYENRPTMCRNYPYYFIDKKEWEDSEEYKEGGLYHIDCTFFN